jgi:hypothetical protein
MRKLISSFTLGESFAVVGLQTRNGDNSSRVFHGCISKYWVVLPSTTSLECRLGLSSCGQVNYRQVFAATTGDENYCPWGYGKERFGTQYTPLDKKKQANVPKKPTITNHSFNNWLGGIGIGVRNLGEKLGRRFSSPPGPPGGLRGVKCQAESRTPSSFSPPSVILF